MSSPGIEVVRADLLQAADVLDGAAESLSSHAPQLRRAPDAGASSGEVARALAAFSGAVSAIGDHLASIAASTRGSVDDFTVTDQAVHGAMAERRGGLAP